MVGTTCAATIGSGKIYDVGKGSYSSDESAYVKDTVMCWAAASSNMIQYWQDQYGDYVVQGTPDGYSTNSFGQPDGTRYLAVYETFLSNAQQDNSGWHETALNWWFSGEETEQLANKAGYVTAGNAPVVEAVDFFYGASVEKLKGVLDAGFAAGGQAVGLNIWQEYPSDFLHNSRYHAITCWGYETDAEGKLTALHLTDSDDREFGAFRAEVEMGSFWNPETQAQDGTMPALNLVMDEKMNGYGSEFVVGICQATTLSTPEAIAKPAVTEFQPLTAGAVVEENIKLSGSNAVQGRGVCLGNGRDAMIAAGESGAGLILEGGFEDELGVEVGLMVEKGAMLSLDNLNVSFYFDGGVDVNGKAYLHNGEVFVCGNFAVESDGAGIYNSGYMEIKDCSEVTVASNQALFKANGGAICNEGTMSIRGNASVNFLENSAYLGEGDDIYNAKGAVLNIADNESVTFMSGSDTVAIANHGVAYLAASKEQSFFIVGSDVDSREGTLYIGMDSSGRGMDGAVSFISGDFGTYTNVTARQPGKAAVFTDVVLNACGVIGNTDGSVAHANISSSSTFTFTDVAMQDVCVTLQSGNVVLDGVQLLAAGSNFTSADGQIVLTGGTNIDLAGFDYVLADGCAMYDLSSVFGSSVADGSSFTLSGFAKADSYQVTCGDSSLFAALCKDLMVANSQTALEGPLVVDALESPELAMSVENLKAAVTLGGGVDDAELGRTLLTQMMENGAGGNVLASLPEGGVTLLPDGLVMEDVDLTAVTDVPPGLQAVGLAENVAEQYMQTLEAARNLAGMYNPVLATAGAGFTANPTVPEPTTGTMALLALTGLAARRRRK